MRTLIARSRFLVVPFALLATTACQRSVSSTVGSTSSSFGVTAPVSGPEARDTNALAAAPPAATSLPALDSPKTFAAAPPPPARPAASAVAAAADPGSALKDMEARSDDRRSVVHAKASFGSGALASATVPLSIAPGPHAMSAEPYGGAFNSGPIAAGEWDDNANYRDFMRYLSNEESLPLHRVDVSDRRFLVVRDVAGKPVPRCRVTVSDQNQHQTTLTTMASGRSILFPHAEGLTGRALTATAACPGNAATPGRAFTLDDQDGAVDLRLTANREIPALRPVDVAFILDTTGSMGEEIDAVRTTIAKVAKELGRQNFQVRLGLVEYKDRGDAFVTKIHPFSSSSERFLADVAKVTAGGGGDTPESVNEGLHAGLTGLEWGQDSVARFAFLIGDAPPHLDYANDADYAVEMKRASHEGIQLFTVAASGMDALGQAVFRQVAEYTGATNLFVLRGGAGPQSTGAGDPKSSCGGTQTNYSSGNLDGLILAKITHELHSLDGDAMRIAGLYRDESAKPCNERVAMAD